MNIIYSGKDCKAFYKLCGKRFKENFMEVKCIVTHLLESNCYIISSGGEAAVIDPGEYIAELDKALNDINYSLKYILLTHTHFDHMSGALQVKDKTGASLCVHELDIPGLTDYNLNLGYSGMKFCKTADISLKDGQKLRLGNEDITVMHTPGHTAGGVCYITGNMIFTGDTLFAGTIGRTNFPGGSYDNIIASLRKIDKLDGDFVIYPGHGPATTLKSERENNVYMGHMDNDSYFM